jgi:antitoxin component HigA of HigAB toxin-antitoxin module
MRIVHAIQVHLASFLAIGGTQESKMFGSKPDVQVITRGRPLTLDCIKQ